jgi:hypothetical protein
MVTVNILLDLGTYVGHVIFEVVFKKNYIGAKLLNPQTPEPFGSQAIFLPVFKWLGFCMGGLIIQNCF